MCLYGVLWQHDFDGHYQESIRAEGQSKLNCKWYMVYFFTQANNRTLQEKIDPAGQQPGGSIRKRLHRHQWQLQPLWQIPGDEVHQRRDGGRSTDLRVPAGEVPSHPPSSVNITFCLYLSFLPTCRHLLQPRPWFDTDIQGYFNQVSRLRLFLREHHPAG